MLHSIHGLPLLLVAAHIESPERKTVLMGIEPSDLSFSEGLSPAVEVAA